jgi:hypothetical protein
MLFRAARRHVLMSAATATVALVLPLGLSSVAANAAAPRTASTGQTVVAPKSTTTAPAVKAAKKKPSPKAYAKSRSTKKYKWGSKQYNCLHRLWHKESKWKVRAGNVNGGPYGIPQAYPGKKMGKGWKTSHVTQINWGLRYIKGRYGTPCKAEGHSKRIGWY